MVIRTALGYPLPPSTLHRIDARASPCSRFYQWENNDGYCGEVSAMQAGLANGQWIDQYQTRALCGGSLDGSATLQSGPGGYCAAHDDTPYTYAQMLFDPCGVDGCADANTCLANAPALHTTPYVTPASQGGSAAYESFMAWVKQHVVAGDHVTVGVLWAYGCDSEYDHIVAVTGVGTNHAPTDATYYDDDVLYWDDHGLFTLEGRSDHRPDTRPCRPAPGLQTRRGAPLSSMPTRSRRSRPRPRRDADHVVVYDRGTDAQRQRHAAVRVRDAGEGRREQLRVRGSPAPADDRGAGRCRSR